MPGARIDNAADIVFDYNDPIRTDPAWWNTVDAEPAYTGIVCEVAGEYATKAPIEPLAVTFEGGEMTALKAKGLPGGLKLDAKKFVIAGAPSKSGVYQTTLTATLADRRDFTKDVRFVVRKPDGSEKLLLVEGDPAEGKVTGAGVYAPGKKVTLKATAAKG